jgi:hypothetical protein
MIQVAYFILGISVTTLAMVFVAWYKLHKINQSRKIDRKVNDKSELNQIARNSLRAYFSPLVALFKAIQNEWSK